jgi:hypothetical protein
LTSDRGDPYLSRGPPATATAIPKHRPEGQDRRMRLFSSKVAPLSEELVKALVDNKDIECQSKREVALDLESVFTNYLRLEREANDRAKDLLAQRAMPQSEFPRLRKLAAEQKGIKVGDDMLDYLLDQLIEMLMHSANVEEVFGEDHDLRRRMRPVLKRYLEVDEQLETEVRGKLKHVQEGTRTWEVEYQRLMGDIQRRKGLS